MIYGFIDGNKTESQKFLDIKFDSKLKTLFIGWLGSLEQT